MTPTAVHPDGLNTIQRKQKRIITRRSDRLAPFCRVNLTRRGRYLFSIFNLVWTVFPRTWVFLRPCCVETPTKHYRSRWYMSVGRGFGCYVCNCATVEGADCQCESKDYTNVNITVFWDVTSWRLVYRYHCLGRKWCLPEDVGSMFFRNAVILRDIAFRSTAVHSPAEISNLTLY
jgi:hypothetical protein